MILRAIKTIGIQVLSAIVILMLTPLLFKSLGAESFGLFSLYVSGLVLLNYFNFGIPQAVIKCISSSYSDNYKSKFIVNSIFVNFALGVFIAMLLSFFGSFQSVYALGFNLWVSSIIPLVMIILVIRAAFEGRNNFGRSSLIRAVLNTSYFIIPLVSIKFNLGIKAYFFHFLFLLLIILISLLKLKSSFGKGLSIYRIRNKSIRIVLGAGLPFFIYSLSAVGLYYSDRFILPFFVTLSGVGIYLLVYDLITRQSIVYGAISQMLFVDLKSIVAEYKNIQRQDIIKGVISFITPFLFLQPLALLVFILLSPLWTEYLGVMLVDVLVPTLIVWAGIYFNVICTVFYKVVIVFDEETVFARYSIYEVLFILPMMIIGICVFGVIGAAVVYFIRSAYEAYFTLFILRVTKKEYFLLAFPFLIFFISLLLVSVSDTLPYIDFSEDIPLEHYFILSSAFIVFFSALLFTIRNLKFGIRCFLNKTQRITV